MRDSNQRSKRENSPTRDLVEPVGGGECVYGVGGKDKRDVGVVRAAPILGLKARMDALGNGRGPAADGALPLGKMDLEMLGVDGSIRDTAIDRGQGMQGKKGQKGQDTDDSVDFLVHSPSTINLMPCVSSTNLFRGKTGAGVTCAIQGAVLENTATCQNDSTRTVPGFRRLF